MDTQKNPNINNAEKKNKALKKDFKIGQFVYIGIYAFLVFCLIFFFG